MMSWVGTTFEVVVARRDKLCLVHVKGELDLANARGFGERLADLSDETVVVDLSDLSFIDSSGFSALISAKNRATDLGHEFVLTRPQRGVEKLFGVVGLRGLIEPWKPEWEGLSRRGEDNAANAAPEAS